MDKPKQSFLKRNKERIKIGCIVGTSLSTIGAIIALIALHLANPAMGAVTVPLAVQALLATLVEKFPKSLEEVKAVAGKMLKDAPENIRERIIDDLSTKYYSRAQSARKESESREPVQTPSEVEEVIPQVQHHKRS
ncbi:MAG: hypothetical protein Q8J97_00375, partial [Flavobacteriaceae bacterium]|nr:hypothetical protein [Flavobacteriaceae bacterium]